jgi:hypothetical protein
VSKENLNLTIQVFTSVVIVLGLGLVVWELRQAQDLTRAQLASEGWLEMMATSRASLSENFAVTRAKACLKPTELSEAELVEMSTYHGILYDQFMRARGYSQIGRYNASSWKTLAERNFSDILSTEIGRAEYATWELRPEFSAIVEELRANNDLYDCQEYYRDIVDLVKENFKQGPKDEK